MVGLSPRRFQCWWYSRLLGWQCDAYPTPDQALARLGEVEAREHFTRGVAIDIAEHLTGQEGYATYQEFTDRHRQYTEEDTNA
jgi:hypothetical protein